MIRWVEMALYNAMQSMQPAYYDVNAARARQLEQFRVCDFSSMSSELAKVYDFGSRIQLRNFALVSRASKDCAPQYIRAPRRTWRGVSEVQAAALDEAYATMRVNEELLEGEQQGVGQQAHLVGIFVSADGTRPELTRIASYEIDEIRFRDPLERDIRNAERVVISMPVVDAVTALRHPSQASLALKLVLTRDHAIMRTPNGQELGLLRRDGSNPTGRIPLVMTRRTRPVDRSAVLPPIADDLYSCQVGVNLGVSDIEFIVRHQSHGRMIIQGPAASVAASMIPDSPAAAWPITSKDVTVQILQSNPAIDKYLAAIEMTLRLYAAYRYLSPEGFRGLTGDAKGMDALGQQDEYIRQEQRCQSLEQDLVELYAAVHNTCLPRALRLPDRPTVNVKYHYVKPRENGLQQMQALDLACARGLADSIEVIQEWDGVSEDEAEQLFEKRLKRHEERLQRMRAFGAEEKTAGTDKIAQQVGEDNGAGGRPTREEEDVRDQVRARTGSGV